MHIKIISTSKTKLDYILKAEAEYLKRFPKGWKIEIQELNTSKIKSENPLEIKQKEGELFLQALPKQGQVYLLDEKGIDFTSNDFSKFLKNKSPSVVGIGGAFGWSDEVKLKASGLISLSKMTFPHQVCRLFLVEQVYRAYTILNNLPYHKN